MIEKTEAQLSVPVVFKMKELILGLTGFDLQQRVQWAEADNAGEQSNGADDNENYSQGTGYGAGESQREEDQVK